MSTKNNFMIHGMIMKVVFILHTKVVILNSNSCSNKISGRLIERYILFTCS